MGKELKFPSPSLWGLQFLLLGKSISTSNQEPLVSTTLQNVTHRHLPDLPAFLEAISKLHLGCLQGGAEGDISACDSCVDHISTGMLSKHLVSVRNSALLSDILNPRLRKYQLGSIINTLSYNVDLPKGPFFNTPFPMTSLVCYIFIFLATEYTWSSDHFLPQETHNLD